MDLSAFREEYTHGGLDREELNENPFAQFRLWFEQACAAKINEPNAMTVCTADAAGKPSARTVLLKAYDERGFVFFTNYTGRKAKQLAENPHAALLFPWVSLERQVEIEGRVEKISAAESLKYFLSRPFGSQLGAWVSHQSTVISSRSKARCRCRIFGAVTASFPCAWSFGRDARIACMTVFATRERMKNLRSGQSSALRLRLSSPFLIRIS